MVLGAHENQKLSGGTFRLVRTILSATFHLFILSPQTPMYDSDENKFNDILRAQNRIGKETLAAPVYEAKSNSLYPQVHIVNNPMPIS